ncbi:penicillin-binding protein 2 [Bacteroidota bacterium]
MKDKYESRKIVINSLVVLIAVVYIIKLFFLQVVNSDYEFSATKNVIRYQTQYPARGLIFDRNDKLIVYNEAAYDLMVSPYQLKPFDTTDFIRILDITEEYVRQTLKEAREYSKYKPSVFLKQVSSETYGIFQEKLFKFPGFFVQSRTIRKYAKPVAANVLGYVSEVDRAIINSDPYYLSGDYIGKKGIESSYEKVLRGEKGVKVYLVDVYNRIKGSYREGREDKPASVGKTLTLTLDIELQEYGEYLMQNKIGSIVAIEPLTGEVLCIVSSPAYDPNLLIGRNRTKNFNILSADTLNVLFNRATMARYPPGSTFKVINGLVALHEKVITPETEFLCNIGFYSKGVYIGCHKHLIDPDLIQATEVSCNTYFCQTYKRIIEDRKFNSYADAYNNWREHLKSFGLGNKLGIDLPNEVNGLLPQASYYDRYYGKNGWSALTIISLSIGQGELGTTPLQLTNMTAAIANRGFYFTPHIVRRIENEDTIASKFKTKHFTSIDSIDFETMIKGMENAVYGSLGATGWRAKMNDIRICGKTGTAENPFGEDHSVFIAFAPKDSPQIAISVYIENGGFGNYWGAPIARLIIEKYLKDTITNEYLENYVLNANLLNRREKKGKHMDEP